MAKQTIQIADKQTLDEIKTLVSENTKKGGIGLTLKYDNNIPPVDGFTDILNIHAEENGGYLYLALIQADVSNTNPSLSYKVTIDDVLIYYKSTYAKDGGSTVYTKSLGVVTPNFYPSMTDVNGGIMNTLGIKYMEQNTVPPLIYTDGAINITPKNIMSAMFYDGPIRFNKTLKIEYKNNYDVSTSRIVYSLD